MGQLFSRIIQTEQEEQINAQGFSQEQILLIKTTFKSLTEQMAIQDNKLDYKALSQYLKIPPKLSQQIIDFSDIDQDGLINDYDFICMLSLFIQKDLKERIENIFFIFDQDHSHVIQEQEFNDMICAILTVQNNGWQISQEMIQNKIQQIKETLFLQEDRLTLQEFFTFIKEDNCIRETFITLGILNSQDFDSDYNEDLENEFNREQDYEKEEKDQHIKNGVNLDQVEDSQIKIIQNNQADEFMAVKPFMGVIRNSEPSNWNSKNENLSEPDCRLELEYIHGYWCFDTRNNVFYLNENEILFHSAAVVIKLNLKNNTQKFNFGNTDDITAFALYGNLIAAGQIGKNPIINLVESDTLQTVDTLVGSLDKGIAFLAFSNDGKFLMATAMNDDHDFAMYFKDNQNRFQILFKQKGIRDVILSIKFSADNSSVIIAGKDNSYVLNFDTKNNQKTKLNKITGWENNSKSCGLCIGLFENYFAILGLSNGNLALIQGTSINKQIPAHKSLIFAMQNSQDKKSLYTGGADGKVVIWDQKLKPIQEIYINTENFISLNPKVRSVDFNQKTKQLLIGTRGGEIIQIDPKTKQRSLLLRGHFDLELWGLATHFQNQEFLTSGEDFLVAKWSIQNWQCLAQRKIKYQSNCCAISFDGLKVLLGCKNGQLLTLNYKDLSDFSDIKISSKELTQIQVSKDGQYIAIGSWDSNVYILLSSSLKVVQKLQGHHSTIRFMDFSSNGRVLQSSCTSYEILFWDVWTGKQDTKGASNNRDEAWQSWTNSLGWPVQGVYPPCSDGLDINSVSRSEDQKLVATGDDFGLVKLFRYPNFKGQSFNKFVGHSSHVTNVWFSQQDQYLISIGGFDKSIFQWKVIKDNQDSKIETYLEQEDDEFQIKKNLVQNQNQGAFDIQDQNQADEFLAIKPWVGDLKASTPKDFKFVSGMNSAPDQNLTLHYVNGYWCFDTRNSAKILANDNEKNIVFISAALGVVMNIPNNTQTFFNKHEEDVISFDLHPNRRIAATGQMAMKGKSKFIDIFVWDTESKQVICQLNGFHLRAVQHLKFTPQGDYLLSIGQDDDNSLAVYDWKKGFLLCTSKVDKTNVLGIDALSAQEFMTVGSRHIKLWTLNGSSVNGRKIAFQNEAKAEAVLCCCAVEKFGYIIGTFSGKIIPVWGAMQKSLEIHQGKVYCLFYDSKTQKVLTGGADGVVNIFSINSQGLVFDKKFIMFTNKESVCPAIRSLDLNNNKILIGTMGSELFYFESFNNSSKYQLVLNGHYKGELWGMCTHPSWNEFATVGEDQLLRIWSIEQRKMIGSLKLEHPARAVTISPAQDLLCVGTVNGLLILTDFSIKILDQVQTAFNKSNQWVQDIKFSPNGNYVAFGAHGGVSPLVVYSVIGNKLKFFASINAGITSALTHLDWDQNSSQIVLNSEAYELKFCNVEAKCVQRASSCSETDWHSWSCQIGFPVQGIYPGAAGFDVHTVDRSKDTSILATGDTLQLVKIFKCPSVQEKSGFKSYIAHSSHVTRVSFSYNDSYLISLGGNDKTSIIWRTDLNKDQGISLQNQEENFEDYVQIKKKKNKYLQDTEEEHQQEEKMEGDFALENEQDNEFMAVKPWLGAIKEPSNFVRPDFDLSVKPELQIDLDYVYGIRCKDKRNNLFFLKENLYYFAAAVGVKLDYKENKQMFFNQHTDDIIAMAIHQEKQLAATGQLGPKPLIYIWDLNTMQQICVLKQGVIKGIESLSFSPSGNRLVAVCIDDNHMTVGFDISKQEMLFCEKGDTAKILDSIWMSENNFVTIGVQHYKYWSVSDKGASGSRGVFGKASKTLVCIAKFNESILCGSALGELQVWSQQTQIKSIQLFQSSLDAIHVSAQGQIFVSGKNGVILMLSPQFKVLSQININQIITEGCSNQIRSIVFDANTQELFISTYGSEIYWLNSDSENKVEKYSSENVQFERLMSGHFAWNLKWTNEVWGLCVLKDNLFLTVSDDATLRLWSALEKKQMKLLLLDIDSKNAKLPLDQETKDLQSQARLRSVSVMQNEKHIAIGCLEGSIRIVDYKKWIQVKIIKTSKRWVQDLKYSPNDLYLAAGAHDWLICIYDVQRSYQLQLKIDKHSSFITHLDWSSDSSFIHSNCGAYELLFFNAQTGQQITNGATALRNEDWSTWTCVLGWPVQGIFRSEWDGSDVNMVARSQFQVNGQYRVIACADDFSHIIVYRYPCLQKNSDGLVLKGHSSHVTNVVFSSTEDFLLSTGGEDQCVMQWKIAKN